MALEITSPAFEGGDMIPDRFSLEQENVNPQLEILGTPGDTVSLLVLFENLDQNNKLHWIVWNVPPHTSTIPSDELPEDAVEGYNDFGQTSYQGPSEDDEDNRYQFHVYALDIELEVDEDVTRDRIEKEIAGHILDEAVLVGTFS